MKLCILLLLAAVSFSSTGCRKPAASIGAVPRDVVVTVNGDAILETQVVEEADGRINANKARDATKGLIFEESAREAMRDVLREDVLRTLIERRLIAQQLKVDRAEITDSEVDARFLEKAREFGQTPEQAEQQIKEQGKTLPEVKERIRWHTIGVEKLYVLHAKDKKVLTEAEALKMYNDYPAEFDREEERRVSHILIRASQEDQETVKNAARARAAALLKRIQDGEGFATLAGTDSEDDLSKARGGDRGWSTRGIIMSPTDDPFGNVAFAMKKVGDISDVVETRDGYHIIQLTGIKEARRLSFDEVKEQITGDFRYREIGNFWEQFSSALLAKARIEWTAAEKARRVEAQKRQEKINAAIEKQIASQQEQDRKSANK